MTLMEITAGELLLFDVVGEGQEIWAIEFSGTLVVAYWGGKHDQEHRLEYFKDQPIKIVRREHG